MIGDPAVMFLSEQSTPAEYQQIRERLGLDKPLAVQYGIYFNDIIRGDLGRSIFSNRPVIGLVVERLINSAKLAVASVLLGCLVGFPLGVIAAVKRRGFLDNLARVIAGLGQALPTFWVGLVLIQVFSVTLGVLPTCGMGDWRTYLMPAFCMSLLVMAGIIRLLRSSMLDALDSEYIKLARIKGVPEYRVIWEHALRNSLVSVVTFASLYFAMGVTIAVAIETVFAWPGLGRLAYESLSTRDFPVLQGVVFIGAAVLVVVNLATDILYAYIDPRIRYD